MIRGGSDAFGLRKRASLQGFNLVEVAFAIAIIAFILTALLGLFSLGIKTNRQSGQEIKAANIAATIVDQRRADPEGTSSLYVLPPLNGFPPLGNASTSTGTMLLTDAGVPTTQTANAAYSLNYVISTSATKVSNLDLSLSWPANSSNVANRDNYEIQTSIVLPAVP